MSVDCASYGPRLPYINPGVKNEWVPLPLLKKFERVPTPKIPWWMTLSNVGSSPHPHTSPYSWKSKTCMSLAFCALYLCLPSFTRGNNLLYNIFSSLYITVGEFYQLCFLIDIKCWGISSSYTLVDNVTRSIQNWWLDLEGFFNFYFLFGSVLFLF